MKQEPVEINELLGLGIRTALKTGLRHSRLAAGAESRRQAIKMARSAAAPAGGVVGRGLTSIGRGANVLAAKTSGLGTGFTKGLFGRQDFAATRSAGVRAAVRNLKDTRSGSVDSMGRSAVRQGRSRINRDALRKKVKETKPFTPADKPSVLSTGAGTKMHSIPARSQYEPAAAGRAIKKTKSEKTPGVGTTEPKKLVVDRDAGGRLALVPQSRETKGKIKVKNYMKPKTFRTPAGAAVSTDESFAPLEKTRARLSEMYGTGVPMSAIQSEREKENKNKNNTAFEPRYFKGTDTKSAIQQAIDYVDKIRSRGLSDDQMKTPAYAEAIRMMSDRKLMSQNMHKFIDADAEKNPIGDQGSPTGGELEMIKARNRQRADKARQLTKDISAKFKAQSNRNSILNTSNRFRQGHQSSVDATERSRRETARTTMSTKAKKDAEERRSRGEMSALDRLLRPAFDPSTLPRM